MSLKIIKHGITIIVIGVLAILSIASGASKPAVKSQKELQEAEKQRLELVFSKPINWTVNNLATWVETVGGIRNSGNEKAHIITITDNISIPPSTDITFGSVKNVRITMKGTVTLSLTGNGRMLNIGEGQEVIVIDLTLRGHDANNSSVVVVAGDYNWKVSSVPVFRMGGKAVITGNGAFDRTYIANPQPLGGVFVIYGIFTMQDNASVNGNKCGGVRIYRGDAAMWNNASVYGNTGGDGVFFVDSYGSDFIMNDNTSIYGNSGRGVSAPTFTMRDNSSITKNTGGGVFVYGDFTMQGGTISGNTTTGDGGGVYARGKKFTMQGGTISGNTARNGGGLFMDRDVTFINNGGIIYGVDAEQNLRNTVTNKGYAVHDGRNWRNTTVEATMGSSSYGFWTND